MNFAFLVLLFTTLSSSVTNATERNVEITTQTDKTQTPKASNANECKKKVNDLRQVAKCYKCCVGELDKASCAPHNNYEYAMERKSCNCKGD